MEYCEGNTLKQLIDRGILQEKPKMVWMLLREILEGLTHMHSKVFQTMSRVYEKSFNIIFKGNYSPRFKTWKYSTRFKWTRKDWRSWPCNNQ